MGKIKEKLQTQIFRQAYSIFRVGTLLLFCGMLTSCSPEHRLARRLGVTKAKLEKSLVRVDPKGEEQLGQFKGLRVIKSTVTGHEARRSAYDEVVGLAEGKFHGPYFTKDSSLVYYLRILSVVATPYVDFTIAQIHQPFEVGDEVFMDKLRRITDACAKEDRPLKEVLKAYEEDKDLVAGMVLTMEQELLSDMIPVAREFLKTADVFEVNISDKVKYPNTAITELLQKLAEPTYDYHIEYAKVTVLKTYK